MISTQKKTSTISIIVPTLNEAENLPLLQAAAAEVAELIVVDGGSTDDTVNIARGLGFRVKKEIGSGGRGMQLNSGAKSASSKILLFLHADTQLPSDFSTLVQSCLDNPKVSLGAFSLKVDEGGLLLNYIIALANLRSRLLHIPYGDQSFFLRKEDFMNIGGFQEVPIMEDFMLVKAAKKRGRIETLPQTVTTSSRRWQRLGPIRTTFINQLIVMGYYLGVSPRRLADFYRKR